MTERRSGLPPLGWALVAVFAVLLLGLLVGQLVLIGQQRSIARDQRALIARQLKTVEPLARDAVPLVERVTRGLPHARAVADRGDRLVRSATPLVQALDVAQVADAVAAVGRIADQLLPALRAVRRSDLVGRSSHAAALVPRIYAVQREALRLQRATLRAQRLAITLQRQQLAVARQTLAVTQQAETHAASLDRKLGGPLPAAVAGGR